MTPTQRAALQARATRLARAREALADLPMVEERALVEAAAEEAQARHDVEVYAHADVLALLAALEGAEAERDTLREAAKAIDQPATAAIGRLRVRRESGTAGLLAHALTGLRQTLAEGKESPPHPSRAEIEAVAGRYRDALPSVEEHLAEQHAEADGPRLLQAIQDALEAAEAEDVDRYRGTDERREFVKILRAALEGKDAEGRGQSRAEAVAAAAGAWLAAQRDLERCKRNEKWEALSPALARVGAAFEALRAAVGRWEGGEQP